MSAIPTDQQDRRQRSTRMNQDRQPFTWQLETDVDYVLHGLLVDRKWKPTSVHTVEAEIADLILCEEERRPGITG